MAVRVSMLSTCKSEFFFLLPLMPLLLFCFISFFYFSVSPPRLPYLSLFFWISIVSMWLLSGCSRSTFVLEHPSWEPWMVQVPLWYDKFGFPPHHIMIRKAQGRANISDISFTLKMNQLTFHHAVMTHMQLLLYEKEKNLWSSSIPELIDRW